MQTWESVQMYELMSECENAPRASVQMHVQASVQMHIWASMPTHAQASMQMHIWASEQMHAWAYHPAEPRYDPTQ